MQGQQGLLQRLLELECSLHGLERGAPLHGRRLLDVLEDDLAPTLSQVFHELDAVLPLAVGRLSEVGGEAGQRNLATREPGRHGEIDVAGIEKNVDMFIGEHLDLLVVLKEEELVCPDDALSIQRRVQLRRQAFRPPPLLVPKRRAPIPNPSDLFFLVLSK